MQLNFKLSVKDFIKSVLKPNSKSNLRAKSKPNPKLLTLNPKRSVSAQPAYRRRHKTPDSLSEQS